LRPLPLWERATQTFSKEERVRGWAARFSRP
jgi:hypothetical protein